nr:DUF429 domain-containing protein [Variibacter gotjawalensis]
MSSDVSPWLAGVDGCRGGWMVAFVRPHGDEMRLRVVSHFADVVCAAEDPAIIAIDMPIGLPDRAGPGGREAERLIRPLLGERQSSVFSVPSRAAIDARDYSEACSVALATSDPPRKVSKQTFNLAPKIREVDAVLRDDAALARRVFEVHPELAFWRLNGERALGEPKRVKSRPYPAGLALRRTILARAGLDANAAAPAGAGDDDLLDALACAAVARRLHAGTAQSFPNQPQLDAFGLKMAIWS